MAIQLNEKITTANTLVGTHEDVNGIGGYHVIETGYSGVAPSLRINQIVPVARRKVGMLVWDVSTNRHYRCTATGTIGLTPDVGGWVVAEILDTSSPEINGGTY